MKMLNRLKTGCFKSERNTVFGIALVVLSYLTCWPVISLLGIAAAEMEKPGLLLIGGPVVYIASNLLFVAGVFLAGRQALSRLAARYFPVPGISIPLPLNSPRQFDKSSIPPKFQS